MKLKTPFVLGLSLCMLTGICFSAAACDNTDAPPPTPPHTQHVDNNKDGKCDECGETMTTPEPDDNYSVSIEIENASVLSGMRVLFYSKSGTSEVKELNGATSVKADLPDGDYTAYLVGNMPGYTYSPVALSASSKTGKIEVDPVEPVEEPEMDDYTGLPTGKTTKKIYYQILTLLPDGKTIYSCESVQVCTFDESVAGACYDAYVDEKTNFASLNRFKSDWQFFPEAKHQVHFAIEEEWPEGCKFDNEKYILSEKGGFFTVMFETA